MKITVAGGGNIGTQFAAHCAAKGHEVTVYTSKPDKFSRRISVVNRNGEVLAQGDVSATDRLDETVKTTDLLFVTTPAFMASKIASIVVPNIRRGASVCLVPGTGGMECAFGKARNSNVIFGLQRVPAVVRTIEYGKTVCATGYRAMLNVAALSPSNAEECAKIIEGIFDIPCQTIDNYLGVTLTPSNPILHPSRLHSIFSGYKDGDVFPRDPLFYEEWDDESSELLFAMNDEVQNICKALPEFDLSCVKSLKLHYESDTPKELTNKIRSIAGFKGIYAPMIETERGFVPDFSSRFFTADFPYGLAILRQIARFVGVNTPYMDEVYDWYTKISGNKSAFSFADYGINDRESFLKFYL